MSELNTIVEAVSEALENAGSVRVVTVFSEPYKKRWDEPVLAVGVKVPEGAAAGFSEYMGERYDENQDKWYEVYGKRLEITVSIAAYSPKDEAYGAGGCLDAVSRVINAVGSFPEGIKVRRFSCGEMKFDEKTGMYLIESELECVCFMYADKTEDTELLDFTLKGVLKN